MDNKKREELNISAKHINYYIGKSVGHRMEVNGDINGAWRLLEM